MTREEAIHIIDTSDLFWTRPTDDEKEALCLAVEALKAEQDTESAYAHGYTDAEAHFHSERNIGKWVKYNGKFYYDWICSECDSCSHERTDYCPMCGAKMEEEK